MFLGMPKEFVKELAAGRYERMPNGGLYFPRKRHAWTGFNYFVKGNDDDSWIDMGHNLITIEGANHMLDVVLHGTSAVATWYVAPFSNNVSPTESLTSATFHSTLNELNTEYSEATRVAYVEAAASARVTTNAASAAVFTSASGSVTIWGCGVLSVSTKRDTTAPLLSVRKFAASYTLPSTGSTLAVTLTHELTYVADT